MAHAQRHSAPELIETLLAEAKEHNFFSLLERLHFLHGDDMELPDGFDAEYQTVRLATA
jgi:hypothetical protein